MGTLLKTVLSCIAALGMAQANAGETLIDVDFSKADVEKHIKAKGSFDGVLPQDATADFPNWNSSEVKAYPVTEDGRKFLRFDVKKFDFRVLFRLSSKPIAVPGYYEATVVCRCPSTPLNVHIRQVPPPYRNFWEEDIAKGDGWVEKHFFIHLEIPENESGATKNVSAMALYISLGHEAGITDIASIKLFQSDKAAFTAESAKNILRAAKDAKNLLRNSRFPLGLQAGWNINRENAEGYAVADPENPGPSGAPSLKLHSPNYIVVYGEPFQTDDPTKKLHVSFLYKAKGAWGVKLDTVSKGLPETAEWRKAELELTPDPMKRGFQLEFGAHKGGTLNIDSLMAWSGDGKRDYVSAGECEVALATAETEMPGTRLFFEEEPLNVKYCVSGNAKGAVLKAKVVNIHDEEKTLPEVKLDGETPLLKSGELACAVFPEAPLGAFRIEAWVERDGKRISPFNEAIVTRIRRPIHLNEDAPNSPFGGHFLAVPRMLSTQKAAGVNWERCNDTFHEATCWGNLEPEKGKWNFPDAKVAKYRDAKIKLLGYLGSAPTWASYYNGQKSPAYFDLMYQPKDIEAFRNYVRTLVSHYKGVIDEYHFQNEPYNAAFWHKGYEPKTGVFSQGATPAQDYAALSKIAYEEMKRTWPEAKMYGFNAGGSAWTKSVFDAGAYPYCDLIDYHCYNEYGEETGFPGDYVEKSYDRAIGYIKENVKPPMKGVVDSESNPFHSGLIPLRYEGTLSFSGLYKHAITWRHNEDPEKIADISCRFVGSQLALGVKRVFLYSDHCYHQLAKSPSFSILVGADGYPSPTLAAFSNMAWLLEDRPFVKRVKVGNDVWASLFEGRGKSVAVFSGKEKGSYTLPRSAALEPLDLFGNKIQGEALYKGKSFYAVSDLPAAKLEALLTQRP